MGLAHHINDEAIEVLMTRTLYGVLDGGKRSRGDGYRDVVKMRLVGQLVAYVTRSPTREVRQPSNPAQ
jgi:hypothetical protein